MIKIIISTILILLLGTFIINFSSATETTPSTAKQYPLCPAGYMVMHAGGEFHMCVPMPVNENQTLNILITPLTMIKEFGPNASIPVSHTRLILSDRFGIDTTAWWPTLLRPEFASTPTHAIIIETVDPTSQSKALKLGFRQVIPADLSRLMLAADPYIGTELSASGGSTWPNITIGKAPWWWPYSFE